MRQRRGDPIELPFEPRAARDWGRAVVDHASSFVRRGEVGGEDCHIKVYEFSTFVRRLRAWPRTSAGRSRAVREHDALAWLARKDLQPDLTCAAFEELDAVGLVRRACLVTRTIDGTTLERCLDEPTTRRSEVLDALSRFVGALVAAGFDDRNLDPRNLIVIGATSAAPQLAKIDSPRWRSRRDSERDWNGAMLERLAIGLRRCGASDTELRRVLADGA